MASEKGKSKDKRQTKAEHAQRLVNFLAPRYAKWKKLRIPEHGEKYWNNQAFASWYKSQIRKAHSLLRIYTLEDVIKALKKKENTWISSLRCSGLIDSIKIEKQKRERAENFKDKDMEVSKEKDYVPQDNKRKKSKSKLDKLRDL